jgi:hypothetical protein
MRFVLLPDGDVLKGELEYLANEHGIRFRTTATHASVASVLINDLQLAIDDEGQILFAFGFCPLVRYSRIAVLPPIPVPGLRLQVCLDDEIVPGVGYRLTAPGQWPVSVNTDSGWLCIGDSTSSDADTSVEFASRSVAVVHNGELKCVWLRPTGLPALV